jgi:crotonobetainyl-CoA:carnitine CoA-transferase CaiB-like acyl-CoA transferase
VKTADVLVENFRSGVTERLGIGPAELRAENRRLVYCKISGFGTSGPGAQLPAYDGVAMGYSGLASLLLDPEDPRLRGPAIADAVTGHTAAFQILAALWAREASGEGAHLEVTMLGSVVHFLHSAVAKWCVDGVEEGADLRTRLSMAFAFTTGDDRALIVHLSSPPKFWDGLCRVTGRTDLLTDARFAERPARVENHESLRGELEPIFRTDTRDSWLRRLQEQGIPCAPVNSVGEAVDHPLYKRLGLLNVEEHEGLGPLPSILPPAHWDGATLGAVARPPLLGEHTAEVLAGLAD